MLGSINIGKKYRNKSKKAKWQQSLVYKVKTALRRPMGNVNTVVGFYQHVGDSKEIILPRDR